jgi:large subunit ribosomal protein L18
MATGPRYAVRFKRRREGKTNYPKRTAILKSNSARLVIRRSNNYIQVQFVKYEPAGDKTLLAVNSSVLNKKYGWKYSCKNTPSAYLIGLLAGKLAVKAKINSAIADIGLKTVTKGSAIFAVVKGAADAGLKINFNPEILPSEDRISGKHIASHLKNKITEDFTAVKAKIKQDG